jgi:hypothetical protein
MEILEIQSSHSLTTSMTGTRPMGAHSYQLNCRQFMSEQRSWEKKEASRGLPLGVMTLGFERLWITAEEVIQVANAIQSTRSPITLG